MGLLSFFNTGVAEAGCDEAGRGCLSGPVFAAAVILPADFFHPLLDDSKKVKEKLRWKLREEIQQQALAYSVAMIDNQTIDKINILNASILAMHRALDNLNVQPGLILVDGNQFKPYKKIPYQCIVGGDGKYFSIAAASILAKTYRDNYMMDLHLRYPVYRWDKNKGYATKDHVEAIRAFGTTPYHRFSFHLKEDQLKLRF